MECKVPQCLASPVCLNTMWVKHSWYTRSVQYLISQQRLHDGTDAQTLYVSHESETHFHGSYRVQRFWLLTSSVFGLFTYALNVLSKINREGRKKQNKTKQSARSESVPKPWIECIGCLHPGATRAPNMCSHISDAPRLAFASMSHFKWKFDLACLHRISSSPF